ncbi:MAG: deoxyribose-phosphate aldolase [Planctomycetes bacterium]|nr:deoxyribose-phosphate aldolase [Planctomycetota bacterium]
MNAQEIASMIDHTILKPEAVPQAIDKLCDEAGRYGFIAVCVNPIWVKRCAERLRATKVRVASVIGFPLGASRTDVKVDETRRAIDDGAVEIDMVIRVGDLIADGTSVVRDDIAAVADAVHAASPEHELKVILETAALTREQLIAGCRCCAEALADFVKTSTGFHPAGGATVDAVRLLHRYASPLKVKAAGGIRTLAAAQAMIAAGATRIGTSSGPAIIDELNKTPT